MASSSKSLKEYLKRKRRNKKQKTKAEPVGVLVMDEDPVWQKPVNVGEDNGDSSLDEDKPVVDEDIEIKRMKRLQQLRARRPLNSISDDGSGWVTVGDSPPKQSNSEPMSPEYSREGADLSTPRQGRKHLPPPPGSDLSAPRKRRQDVDADFSPPRKSRKDVSEDLSPPRKGRKHADADLSPPRKSRNNVDTDLSPPRKGRRDVDADRSPPRKSRKDVDDDLSPPRNKKQVNPHPRKGQAKVALISGGEISDEINKTKKDAWLRFQHMDPSVSGREAVPIYRDKKTGERISKEELLKSSLRKIDENQRYAGTYHLLCLLNTEIKLEWGEGLAQKREAETKLEELELEKEKPFARTRDDPELDKILKERTRWGDPMAHLVKKKHSEPVLANLGVDEKMKESGFVIPQDIPVHSWLKRGLDAAPNRHGIRPGRHWDGVDRSNGFEKGMFKRKNEKQATQAEAYLWSEADM
ncbi:BUD13-like protein [Pyrus ussuriensis x Pyrus communis]|uniref:BUD13-like protein n=1 Tax=Pyrus ussuriensis x Pyrus communis TaxID=2448454 RepID=A0A5N5H8L1_9ROSA|nr:BUD13-like protein [Pyrus ussuriensis x Pyrus communis]